MERRMPVFADRFIELRGKRTQDEFAKFLGISRPTVGFYESGQRIPDALVLRQIAEKCNVSADYLLGLTDEKTPEQDIQAICKKTGLSERSLAQIIYAKESKLNCDGLFFELLNNSIPTNTKDPSIGFSFLGWFLECLFNYKNSLEAKHILLELSDRLYEDELKKMEDQGKSTADESVLEEAAQNTHRRFIVESHKLESDARYPKTIRRLISAQNRIDKAFPLCTNPHEDLFIEITDIYRDRINQCIMTELSRYELLYRVEP